MSMRRTTSSCSCCPRNRVGHVPAGSSRGIVHESGGTARDSCSTRRLVQPGSTTSGLISTEVNGFVSWIASFAFFLCFLVWAVVPHEYIHQLSISYLLNTYWALAVPVLVLIGLISTFLMYNALNLLNIQPLESFCLVSDELAPPPCADRLEELHATAAVVSAAGDASSWQQLLTPPQEDVLFSQVQDLPLSLVNKIMFRVPTVVEDCMRSS